MMWKTGQPWTTEVTLLFTEWLGQLVGLHKNHAFNTIPGEETFINEAEGQRPKFPWLPEALGILRLLMSPASMSQRRNLCSGTVPALYSFVHFSLWISDVTSKMPTPQLFFPWSSWVKMLCLFFLTHEERDKMLKGTASQFTYSKEGPVPSVRSVQGRSHSNEQKKSEAPIFWPEAPLTAFILALHSVESFLSLSLQPLRNLQASTPILILPRGSLSTLSKHISPSLNCSWPCLLSLTLTTI